MHLFPGSGSLPARQLSHRLPPHPRTFPLLIYLDIHALRNQRGDPCSSLGLQDNDRGDENIPAPRASQLQDNPSSESISALRASRLQENLGSESILALSWTQEAEGSGQTRVLEQDACTSCCITEIMILVHHGKRQESEFPLGQWCGQEGLGAVLQDIGPPCLLLLGPLVCRARALKKPAEQTSLLCSCSAPRLFP